MKQIRLTKGLYALVDDDDFEWLSQWNWHASNESRGTKWYAIRRENGVKIRMHVAIWTKHNGPVPNGHVIDHVNHNSLDNRKHDIKFTYSEIDGCILPEARIVSRICQLEAVTQAENMRRSPGWKRKGQKVKR